MRAKTLILPFLVVSACARAPSSNSSQVADATSAPQKLELYFHWGSVQANNDLLTRAGYADALGHDTRYEAKPVGTINAALIDLTRDWFTSGGQSDASGPGLYVSSSPVDSQDFGQDLLVVTREPLGTAALPPIASELSSIFKTKATTAIAQHQDGTLPAINRYTNTWSTIFRPATPADAYALHIRPPQPGDEARIIDAIAHSGDANAIAANLAQACSYAVYFHTKTKPAFEVLKALTGDDAFKLLTTLDYASLTDFALSDFEKAADCVVQGDAAKQATLDQSILVRRLNASRPLSTREWQAIADAYPQLSDALQTKALAKFVDDAKRLYLGTLALGSTQGPYLGALAAGAILAPNLSADKKAELAITLPILAAAAHLNPYTCDQHVVQLKFAFSALSNWPELSLIAAQSCFSMQNLLSHDVVGEASDNFYTAYLATTQALATSSSATSAQMAAFFDWTIKDVRSLYKDSPYYHGDQVVAAAAAYASVAANPDDKALLLAAVKKAFAASGSEPGAFENLQLSAFYASLAWVKKLGFSAAMKALVDINPSARAPVVAQIQTLRASLANALEQDQLDALIKAIQAP